MTDRDEMAKLLEQAQRDVAEEKRRRDAKDEADRQEREKQRAVFEGRASTLRVWAEKFVAAANQGWNGALQLSLEKRELEWRPGMTGSFPATVIIKLETGAGTPTGLTMRVMDRSGDVYVLELLPDVASDNFSRTVHGERLDFTAKEGLSILVKRHLSKASR